MLELQRIRTHTAQVVAGLAAKGIQHPQDDIDQILAADEQRRATQAALDAARNDLNQASKAIGTLLAQGQPEQAQAQKAHTTTIKTDITRHEETLQTLEQQQQERLLRLPNIPSPAVPHGNTPDHNTVLRQTHRDVPFTGFTPKPHWDLAKDLDIIDFELGVKITGAGFPVYKAKGAKLQRALIAFFLDRATAAGYQEVMPPHVVNAASGFGTGQLPDKEGQMYYIPQDDLYLIPTAEVPLTNLFRDTLLAETDLPIAICGYTPCFRREAGSYGAHVRGLNRLHQFDKVEIVRIERPEHSYQALEHMTDHVMALLDDLQLPYRQLLLCAGDMSFASAQTYDLEVWSAAQARWLEVSSVSNFETFQAHRLKLRYKADKTTRLAHTLNGSALALPRIVAALLENHQQPDGSVAIPPALRPYTGFDLLN